MSEHASGLLCVLELRQEVAEFNDSDGEVHAFAVTCRKDASVGRARTVALMSHLREQAGALLKLLGPNNSKIGHCVMVRLYDDTNVKTAPPRADADNIESENGKKGRRRVSQLLGMVQHLMLRRVNKYGEQDAQATEIVQIHCPSQIIPKVGCTFSWLS